MSSAGVHVWSGSGALDQPGQVDARQGASGGPLWGELDSGRRQVCFVSYCPTCGLSPGVYTDLTAFIGWVEGATGRQLASFPDIPQTTHERNIETRSEEHTSELQSLMRISYAVFCLKQKRSKRSR